MRIAWVKWTDAITSAEPGWATREDAMTTASAPLPTMYTIGYILHNDKNHITLASTIGPKECSTTEKIPTSFIKSITKLSPEIQVEQSTKNKGK